MTAPPSEVLRVPTPAPVPSARRRTGRWGGPVALLLVGGWALAGTAPSPGALADGWSSGTDLAAGLLRPDLDPAFLRDVAAAALETVQISIAALLLSAVVAAPLALGLTGAAGGPPLLRAACRGSAAVLRGVPELVWALLFVATLGLGPAAGVCALTLHGAGLLAKLWAEQLDGVDPRPVEAVRLAGAGRPTLLALAVLPQARTGLTSLLLYQWECNVRTATVLGIVGAGGLGQAVLVAVKLFDHGQLATLVVVTLALVLGVDAVSRLLRRRLGAAV